MVDVGPLEFASSRQRIIDELRKLLDALRGNLAAEHVLRRVAASQSIQAVNAIAIAGSVRAAGLGDAYFRAGVYSQAQIARELEAYLFVSKLKVLELSTTTLDGFGRGQLTSPLIALRSLVERIASATALSRAIRAIELKDNTDIQPLILKAEVFRRYIYGTMIDWDKVAAIDMRKASSKDIKYMQKELTADASAQSIMSCVDKLEKRVPGIRVAYDVMCEFLHPNVGDLFSATTKVKESVDNFGTHHQSRVIANVVKSDETHAGVNIVLARLLDVVIDAVRDYPSISDELGQQVDRMIEVTKRNLHRTRSTYPKLFRGSDYCPCLSGRKVRDCN
jgi:hypothetical protein